MTNKNCLVSIVVPVYNAEKLIARCVESLLLQTYKNIQIILVNDGSKDNTSNILDDYQKEYPTKIKVIHKENEGPAVARNIGIAASDGDFIGFVDSDDYVSPLMYEELIAEVSDEIDLVICGRYNINEYGSLNKVMPSPDLSGLSLKENPSLLLKTTTFVWDKIFRRKVLISNGISFPEDIRYAEDFCFLTVFKYYCRKIKVVSLPLYYYYSTSAGSITNECNETWLDIVKALEFVNGFFMKKGIFHKYSKELESIAFGFYIRRIKELHFHTNKKMQAVFIKEIHSFLESYFPNWKIHARYRKKRGVIVPESLIGAISYAYIPNPIKRLLTVFYENIYNLKCGSFKYAWYRRFTRVKKDSVLFLSHSGASVSDNPYYMARDLDKKKSHKIYYASSKSKINENKINLNFNGLDYKLVEYGSKKFIKLLASANFVVTNSTLPSYVSKRKSQVFVNTWHGTPLKTLGMGMKSGLRDIGNTQQNFLMSDYMLFPNEYTEKHMMRDFYMNDLYSGKVIVSGYPRNEALLDKDSEARIRKDMDLEGVKVYCYMPTWRGVTTKDVNSDDFNKQLNCTLFELDKVLNNKAVLYVKIHQNVKGEIDFSLYDNIYPFPDSYESYAFLNVVDCLITDYSSVFFDYAVKNKQIILYMPDYQDYTSARGLYTDIDKLPFTKVYSVDSLVKCIKDSGGGNVNVDYHDFIKYFCCYESINASKNINDIVFYSKESPRVKFIDNSTLTRKVYFCNPVEGFKEENDFYSFIDDLEDDCLLMFNQRLITKETENILSLCIDKNIKFVVYRGGMSVTLGEQIILAIYRRFGLLKKPVINIYKTELNRLLPNISIESIKNLTSIATYRDLEKLQKEIL